MNIQIHNIRLDIYYILGAMLINYFVKYDNSK